VNVFDVSLIRSFLSYRRDIILATVYTMFIKMQESNPEINDVFGTTESVKDKSSM
jgi:hypothetical protein